MRPSVCFLAGVVAFSPSVRGALVSYANFEIGAGYLDSGNRYVAHGTGAYITVPLSEAQSRGYATWGQGAETVIGGTKNASASPPPEYVALIFKGSFLVNDSSTNNFPLAYGIPYTGGTSPLSAGVGNNGFNDNGNSPAQGSLSDLISPSFPSSTSGSPQISSSDLGYGFTAYDSSGNPVFYTIVDNDGQQYLNSGDGLSVPISDSTAIPVYYKDSSGNLQQGFYNSSTGQFSASPSGDNGNSGSVDVSGIINAVNNQGSLTRDQLVQLLGSAGNSWVYDCKLSLSQLYSLAVGQGLITRPQIDLSGIQSSLTTIASKPSVDVSGLATEHTLSSVNTALSSLNSKLDTVNSSLDALKDTTIPSFSSPDFGSDMPDDSIPWDVSGFNSSVSQSLGDLVSWGNSGAPRAFDFDIVSGLLTYMVGTIPSVGSDSSMFSIEFDLPVVGHVQKQWTFSEISFIGEFRSFLLWVIYVFFALACFKLLHASII